MNTAAVISWLSHWPMLWVPLSLAYVGLVGTMALTAVFSSLPARRKAAVEVLRLLLPGRRPSGHPPERLPRPAGRPRQPPNP
jgi:hypothetical protein